jgi:CRISPR-associated protein Cas1
MRELLNVLYVLTQGTYLHLDHDTVRLEVERETKARIPLLRLSGVVVFGDVLVSPALIHRCAEDGCALTFLDRNGRFMARVEGPTKGNVLLRRAQHLALSDAAACTAVARQVVAAKVQNSRQVLLRAAREADGGDSEALSTAATRLADSLNRLRETSTLDSVRGCEGEAARHYFAAFPRMVREDRAAFAPAGRTRRPPRDRMNAVLSFLYAILRQEVAAALEGVGLDPQVGYLHALRPGRPALALDLMEELRPVVADRLALTLVNRRQLRREHFEELPGGAWRLTDEGRRTVIVGYQTRKEEEVMHRVIDQKAPWGLVPHVQARLLARHLRGDLAHYPPFLAR